MLYTEAERNEALIKERCPDCGGKLQKERAPLPGGTGTRGWYACRSCYRKFRAIWVGCGTVALDEPPMEYAE